ncbi:hypothetical protein [Neobacillus terrae]|uniref:hypothetical protein n=1 Tax=Neobacillus terrae TaxID=3034837 RepID=UPI0014080B53|nr:hypothetical protein [Neobacillus terrae]NHM30814.1 hypothetical protein [Neobacillus terrae]
MEKAIQFLESYMDKWRRWAEMADGVGMPTEPFTRKIGDCSTHYPPYERGKIPHS